MIAGINFNSKPRLGGACCLRATTLYLESYCTVSVTVAECVRLPDVPVTVREYVPDGVPLGGGVGGVGCG